MVFGVCFVICYILFFVSLVCLLFYVVFSLLSSAFILVCLRIFEDLLDFDL